MVVLLDGDGTLATLALLKSKGVLLVIEPSLGGDKAFVLSRRFGVSVATELSSTATSNGSGIIRDEEALLCLCHGRRILVYASVTGEEALGYLCLVVSFVL
ncbi:hypothetical protein YC2023_076902 [Brassica napus]